MYVYILYTFVCIDLQYARWEKPLGAAKANRFLASPSGCYPGLQRRANYAKLASFTWRILWLTLVNYG